MIPMTPIGFIRNACPDSREPELIKKEVSVVEVLPPYAEGLLHIEQCEYLDLLFSLHREQATELTTRIRTGERKGIFATRSPRRPNHIGATTVRLLRREGNSLYVEGADALDGSPLLDIKHCDTSLFDRDTIRHAIYKTSPRLDTIAAIIAGDTPELLLQAARLHGHICPGLALGVMAATQVMRNIYAETLNPDDFALTLHMKNCPIDGILYVTGLTPGNNRITLRPSEEMHTKMADRAGNGWSVRFSASAAGYIDSHLPPHLSPQEKGFALLHLDPAPLFTIERL